jgi:Ca2+-binding EF-hand superfamily protein
LIGCECDKNLSSYADLREFVALFRRVTLKDLKAFLPRVNCKISTGRLRELFQEVDTRKRTELGFDDFATLYHKLMFDEQVRLL